MLDYAPRIILGPKVGKVTAVPTLIPNVAKLQVRSFGRERESIWDEYVHQNPGATPFHLSAWKRTIEKVFPFESRYMVAEAQGAICGVLPLFFVKNLLSGRALISSPFAVYGGICADDAESGNLLRQAACEMAQQEDAEYLELREQTTISDVNFHTKKLYVTFDQALPESAEGLLQGFPRDTRYMIRKAQKNGLRAVVDNSQMDIFYEIYAHSVHQLGTPVFSRKFFRTLGEEFGEQCEIMVVWHGGRAMAAVLSLKFRDSIFPYYGGSVPEGRALAANNFMYWELMKRALETGIRYFDFGRSKLGTGAYAFKKQWNMRERPLPYQYYLVRRREMPNYSPANSRFQLATKAWKRVPFPLTKVLGPVLVRLFP